MSTIASPPASIAQAIASFASFCWLWLSGPSSTSGSVEMERMTPEERAEWEAFDARQW